MDPQNCQGQVDVLVVGSCNTDLISYVSRFPRAGETIHGHRFSTGFGGKGANQCVMAARLGARTAMVGKVGDDSFGRDTLQNFKDNAVITDYLKVAPDSATGVAPITVADNGQNSIVIVSGANFLVTETEVEQAISQMSSAKVLVCQLEIRPEITLAALKAAKAKGITTILNPAPGVAGLGDEFYSNADFFCPNESEAEVLTGLPVTTVDEAKTASVALLQKGCKAVVITLGGDGIVYLTMDAQSPVHLPVTPVQAVDTTGAGDAFIGSFAYFLAHHAALPLDEILRRACRIATISVLQPGTQTSFPWRKDLPEELLS
ncbi:ribokinase-like [Diadema setosum]|uniref:ribokinase-like n=1 Tax=Diadema setosum TaxID=31175 RepID=UPI003B3A52CC